MTAARPAGPRCSCGGSGISHLHAEEHTPVDADTRPAAEPRALVLARRAADGKALSAEEGAALLADIEHLHAALNTPPPAADTACRCGHRYDQHTAGTHPPRTGCDYCANCPAFRPAGTTKEN